MSFIIGILVFALIVNCGVLLLLILMQPPKKDAGVGLAFGGGAADALFGAGSGNALTKITKWATVTFVLLAIFLGSLESRSSRGNQSEFEQAVEQQQQMQAKPVAPPQSAPMQSSSPQTSPQTSQQTTPSAAPSAAPILSLPATTNAPMSTPSALVPATTTTNGK